MKAAIVVLILALGVPAIAAAESQTFIGVVTDTMCNKDHAPMKVTPDEKCVAECVKSGSYKLGLNTGTALHLLSDQQTPVRFAGKKVKVVGTLYTKTNILKVDSIEAVK